jgi:hypothetical protein
MKHLFIAIIFAGVSLLSAPILAQVDSLTHHVLVLLDRSGSVKRVTNGTNAVKQLITRSLPHYLLDTNIIADLPANRALLQPGDYLSIMSFGFEQNNPDVEKFIEMVDGSNRYGLAFNQSFSRNTFDNLWQKINNPNGNYQGFSTFFRKNWTGLSFAGPLALNKLHDTTMPKDINRTFVIIVTDGEFNDINDPNNEIKVIGMDHNGYTSIANKDSILTRYNKIREVFLWDQLLEYPISAGNRTYKFEIMEYKPIQKTFAIEALMPFDPELVFKRTPHGYHSKDLKITPYKDNPNFSLEKMRLTGYDSTQQFDLFTEEYTNIYNDTSIWLTFDNDDFEHDLYLKAQFWVHFDDGVYGGHTLHPGGSSLQGKKGLNKLVKVYIEPRAEIYWFIPLWDILYIPLSFISENQYTVKAIYEISIPLLLIIVAFIYNQLTQKQTKVESTDLEM